MLNCRDFMASALATCSLGMSPALAHQAAPYVLPKDHLPVKVRLRTKFAPGEIHVDPNAFKLYWTLPGGSAMRYTVGVGRANLYEAGTFHIGAKKEWPSWTPTPGMIARQPELYAEFAHGMPGGIDNPLGARALYLFTPERVIRFYAYTGRLTPGPSAQPSQTAAQASSTNMLLNFTIECPSAPASF